jgi:hypothetical protein
MVIKRNMRGGPVMAATPHTVSDAADSGDKTLRDRMTSTSVTAGDTIGFQDGATAISLGSVIATDKTGSTITGGDTDEMGSRLQTHNEDDVPHIGEDDVPRHRPVM